MKISHYFKAYKEYIFKEEMWIVGARYLGHAGKPSIIENSTFNFSLLKANKKYWFADPFIIIENNECYVFFEMFDRRKEIGKIGYSIFKNGFFTTPKVVIDNKSHLSFPHIFKDKHGDIFIIPESSEKSTLCLYKAICFPDKWEMISVIMDNVNIVDSVLFDFNGKEYLLGSTLTDDFFTNNLWLYDIEFSEEVLIKKSTLLSSGNFGDRNAGSLFSYNGVTYRTGQDNSHKEYGKGLVIYRIIDDGKTNFKNEYIKSMYSNDFIDGSLYKGVHTYNFFDGYEVVDFKTIKKNGLARIMIRIIKLVHKKIKGD